eukprot:scaffold662711_cov43-Attheya_sp.AAC.1
MGRGGKSDDTATLGHGGQQESGQKVMAHMVGSELQFEPLGGFHAPWRCHDTRIVDQQINSFLLFCNGVSGLLDGGEVGQITELHSDIWVTPFGQTRSYLFSRGHVAHTENHGHARQGQ